MLPIGVPILNVISLEVQHTVVASEIIAPRVVRDLDWMDQRWPSDRKTPEDADSAKYPKVQCCIISYTERI